MLDRCFILKVHLRDLLCIDGHTVTPSPQVESLAVIMDPVSFSSNHTALSKTLFSPQSPQQPHLSDLLQYHFLTPHQSLDANYLTLRTAPLQPFGNPSFLKKITSHTLLANTGVMSTKANCIFTHLSQLDLACCYFCRQNTHSILWCNSQNNCKIYHRKWMDMNLCSGTCFHLWSSFGLSIVDTSYL